MQPPSSPTPLNGYRKYALMFALNLAILVGVLYFLRREPPRAVVVTHPSDAPAVVAISVNVSGAVNQPGTVKLTAGARLADALQKVGGVKPEADLSHLNLTLALKDGDKINVPARAEAAPAVNNLAVPTVANSTPLAAPVGKINLNTATLAELDSLPGIGPALAQRIVEYREANGGFTTVEQVKDVRGIGNTLFEEIQALVTVQ